MGHKNREIEVKLLVEGAKSLDKINRLLGSKLKRPNKTKVIKGISKDVYWKTEKACKADFIRLRYYPEGPAQITVKHTDKGDNLDRVEIDLEVESGKTASLLISSLLGEVQGSISKRYFVYVLEDEHTTVSAYQIVNDPRIFIEVEAKTKKRVFQLIKEIESIMSDNKLTRVNKSLYQLFIKNKAS